MRAHTQTHTHTSKASCAASASSPLLSSELTSVLAQPSLMALSAACASKAAVTCTEIRCLQETSKATTHSPLSRAPSITATLYARKWECAESGSFCRASCTAVLALVWVTRMYHMGSCNEQEWTTLPCRILPFQGSTHTGFSAHK